MGVAAIQHIDAEQGRVEEPIFELTDAEKQRVIATAKEVLGEEQRIIRRHLERFGY